MFPTFASLRRKRRFFAIHPINSYTGAATTKLEPANSPPSAHSYTDPQSLPHVTNEHSRADQNQGRTNALLGIQTMKIEE